MTDDNKRAPITRQVSDIFTVSFSSEESPPIVVGGKFQKNISRKRIRYNSFARYFIQFLIKTDQNLISRKLSKPPVRMIMKSEQHYWLDKQTLNFWKSSGYGLFNYFILLALLPGAWTNSFDTTAIAYVLTSAECDLKLTLNQKGMLNAAIYAGEMSCSLTSEGTLFQIWEKSRVQKLGATLK